MSTEQRDKAFVTEIERFPGVKDQPPFIRAVATSWFAAGWDARGQATPDRPTKEAIMFAINGASSFNNYGDWAIDIEDAADAIFALLNEKGNE